MNAPLATKPHFIIRAIRGTYRTSRFFFASIGIFCTLVPLVIGYLAWKGYKDMIPMDAAPSRIAKDAKIMLSMRLHGKLSDRQPDERAEIFGFLFGSDPVNYLPDTLETLRAAAKDERVKGLFISVENFAASQAAVSELRSAIQKFRGTGRPVYIHLSDADTQGYFLGSVADKLAMAPAGSLEIPGPIMQLVYLRSALEKLGVEFQVMRAGKFKSAFEPLIADQPSAETTFMYQSLEESLRSQLVESISTSRKKTAADVRAWLKRGMFTAKEAEEQGLVDKLVYLKEFEVASGVEVGAIEVFNFAYYAMAAEAAAVSIFHPESDAIGLIEASGEMLLHASGSGNEDSITPRAMARALKWARDNDKIKAVVLRISSPGGSALAADLIWDEVMKTKAKKPVIVSMGAMAASGGYYIAAPASKIFADAATITGSIGVIAGMPKLTSVREKWGVSFHTITGSDRVALYSPDRKGSAEDEALLAAHVDHTYKIFLERVASGRKMEVSRVDALAQGRVYTGAEALKLGLVDVIGGLDDAIQGAIELANLDTKSAYPTTRYQEDENLMDCLRSLSALRNCATGGSSRSDLSLARLWPEQSITSIETQLLRLRELVTQDRELTLAPMPMRVD